VTAIPHDVVLGERLQTVSRGVTYVCNVQEIKPDGRLIISAPQGVHEASVPLMPGEVIQLSYYSGGGQYTFSAKVNERIYEDGVLYYAVRFASLITKSQRRGYVRVDLTIPLSIRTLTDSAGVSLPKHAMPPVYETTTIDLSGGGVAFASSAPMEPGTRVLCEMVIGGKPFREESVVTFMTDEPTKKPRYKICTQFTAIGVPQRKILIKYLMEEEIRIRRMTQ